MVDETKATEDPQPSGFKKSTTAERGAQLPLGVLSDSGAYVKTMVPRPWRMKEEKELAKLVEDRPEMNIAEHVAVIVATMYDTLGPHDFSTMDDVSKRLIVSQMFMGDVWYAYFHLRINALGSVMKLQIKCPKCKNDYPFPADLNSAEVSWGERLEDLLWEFTLKTPVKMRGLEVKKFRMGPQRWSVLEAASETTGAVPKEVAIRASIMGLDDIPDMSPLGKDELDELLKVDIERAAGEIDEHYLGPDMSIELGGDQKCPHCRFAAKRRLAMDWRYDNFFVDSSP